MPKSSKKSQAEPIIIDEEHGLVFANEDELYRHFAEDIKVLERDFFGTRRDGDVSELEFKKYDKNLEALLDDPDEVWEDGESLAKQKLFVYLRHFEGGLYHVAVCYLTQATPSFVYLHFPTNAPEMIEHYRRGQLVFRRGAEDMPLGALDGDALTEGDELATGLFEAMLRLRSSTDIPEDEFGDYADCREHTLDDADEIWRHSDSLGNVLVSFLKEFNEETEFWYVVVTVEDAPSGSHALLFSFPTTDQGLLGRYRHGENLQAEEVVQESSH